MGFEKRWNKGFITMTVLRGGGWIERGLWGGGGDFKGGMECCTEGYAENFDRGVVKVENELGKIRRRERV